MNEKRHCDICAQMLKRNTDKLDIIIDGRTKTGHWAWMCTECHALLGVGLGTGKGQKFEWQGDKYIKTGG
jgi:hypothetical protein